MQQGHAASSGSLDLLKKGSSQLTASLRQPHWKHASDIAHVEVCGCDLWSIQNQSVLNSDLYKTCVSWLLPSTALHSGNIIIWNRYLVAYAGQGATEQCHTAPSGGGSHCRHHPGLDVPVRILAGRVHRHPQLAYPQLWLSVLLHQQLQRPGHRPLQQP